MLSTNAIDLVLNSVYVPPQDRNVGYGERLISCLSGLVLGFNGIRKFRKGGCFLLFPAGYLLWRSASGFCYINKRLGRDTTEAVGTYAYSRDLVINKKRSDLYNFCKTPENFPLIMKHITKAEKTGDNTYRLTSVFWDQALNWNAEILQDVPDKRIIWRSLPPFEVENYGLIEFFDQPSGKGTEMRIIFVYKPSDTLIGKTVGKVLNLGFTRKINQDLDDFKQFMENNRV